MTVKYKDIKLNDKIYRIYQDQENFLTVLEVPLDYKECPTPKLRAKGWTIEQAINWIKL